MVPNCHGNPLKVRRGSGGGGMRGSSGGGTLFTRSTAPLGEADRRLAAKRLSSTELGGVQT